MKIFYLNFQYLNVKKIIFSNFTYSLCPKKDIDVLSKFSCIYTKSCLELSIHLNFNKSVIFFLGRMEYNRYL
jgi:hypothetical protein